MSNRTKAFFRGMRMGLDPTRMFVVRFYRLPSTASCVQQDWSAVAHDLHIAMQKYERTEEGRALRGKIAQRRSVVDEKQKLKLVGGVRANLA